MIHLSLIIPQYAGYLHLKTSEFKLACQRLLTLLLCTSPWEKKNLKFEKHVCKIFVIAVSGFIVVPIINGMFINIIKITYSLYLVSYYYNKDLPSRESE